MTRNKVMRPIPLYGLVDGAAAPDKLQPLLDGAGAPYVSVYEGLPEAQAAAASLFVVRIDNAAASWALELDAIDLQTPCLVLIWSDVELADLAGHLRAFLFAQIGDGLTAMVRYFDPRNVSAVFRVWGEQVTNLFMAPLRQIRYRGRHEHWFTVVSRSREAGRTSTSVVIELDQDNINVLTAHTEPDELMASLADLGHIDEARPYRERFLEFENRYQRAIEWGLVEARDRLGYCEYSYRYGKGFDMDTSVRNALEVRRNSGLSFENAMSTVPGGVWRAMRRQAGVKGPIAAPRNQTT